MKFFDKMSDFNEVYQDIYLECKEELKKQKIKTIVMQIVYICMLFGGGILILQVIKSLDHIGYIVNMNNSVSVIGDVTSFIGESITICIVLCAYIKMAGNYYTKTRDSYNKTYKEKVIKTMIKSFSGKLNYNPRAGVGGYGYIDADFESFDELKAEDGISGRLEDKFSIKISEVHTKRKQITKNGRVNFNTVFHGLFAELETDKYVEDTIKIRKNTIKIFDSNDRLEMDSGEFEKIYDIYSKNKIEAMQIFTADILQLFIDFEDLNPDVTIKNNKIYIRFETGDVFEPTFLKNALEYETLKKYYYMIGFMLYFSKEIYKNLPLEI